MNILKIRSVAIRFLEEKSGHMILYFLFVLLFFISTEQRWPRNFFYALMIPTFLISLRTENIRRLFSSSLWRITLILLVYLLLTMLWGENPGKERPIYFIRNAFYLLTFFILTMELTIRHSRFPEKLFVLLAWVGAVTAFLSVLLFYRAAPLSDRLIFLADQLDNPVLGGILYGMIVLIVCFHILQAPGGRPRWLYILFLAIIAGSMLMTQSRGPVAVLLATLVIGGLITRNRRLLIALGCIIVIGAAVALSVKPYREMVTQRGMSYRVELAKNTIAMIQDDPVFGKGLTTDQRVMIHEGRRLRHPHNVYLAMALYGGLTGLAILVLLLATALREGWKHYKKTGNITLPALVLFAAGTIMASQDKLITTTHPLWFFFWLPIAILAGISCRETGPADPSNNKP
ncbi:MAG: O-antigen ligase family protein [Thermodesulfobacteriota bacterium]